MRCCANILNLIAKDGINEVGDSISNTWWVKYVRSYPGRGLQFQASVDQERITSNLAWF